MLSGTFRSLGRRNYRLWAIGALFSNIGTWMQFTTQDWLVLTELTHNDATAIGIIMALQLAPPLLFLLWTGLIADRVEKHRFLVFTQMALGTLAIALGLLVITGAVHLWQVNLFAFLSGCVAAFDSPVRQTFVGELVGEKDLPNAVAINSISYNAGRMIGPAIAGVCIAQLGSGWSFILNGVSFFGVALSLLAIRQTDLFPLARATTNEANILTSGLRYVWHRKDLRTLLLMLFIIGAFGLNFPVFISTMAVSVFHVGAHGYGVLTSALAVGTIVGGLLAARRRSNSFRPLLTGSLIFAAGCLAAALAPTYWLFALTLVVIGISSLTFTATSNSFMQLSTDPAMRGRVLAIRFAIFAGSTPFGAPAVGWVANHFGPRWSLGVGALSGVLSALIATAYLWSLRSETPEKS